MSESNDEIFATQIPLIIARFQDNIILCIKIVY